MVPCEWPEQYDPDFTPSKDRYRIEQEPTKEEREAKAKKNYLANGKLVWSSDGGTAPKPEASKPVPPKVEVEEDDDSLPF